MHCPALWEQLWSGQLGASFLGMLQVSTVSFKHCNYVQALNTNMLTMVEIEAPYGRKTTKMTQANHDKQNAPLDMLSGSFDIHFITCMSMIICQPASMSCHSSSKWWLPALKPSTFCWGIMAQLHITFSPLSWPGING
jgi:hypothetical protein